MSEKPILELVDHVFKIERNGDEFLVYETCDYYFERVLTRDQLKQLAREILDLAEQP